MDGVLCDYNKSRDLLKSPDNPFPQSQYGFFLNLEPIYNSVPYVMALDDYFDLRVATAPSVKNPLCYTEKRVWIEKYYGEINLQERLYIIPDKSALIGDFLVDDYDSGRGQDKFTGELIHFGSDQFPYWKNVYNYLLSKK